LGLVRWGMRALARYPHSRGSSRPGRSDSKRLLLLLRPGPVVGPALLQDGGQPMIGQITGALPHKTTNIIVARHNVDCTTTAAHCRLIMIIQSIYYWSQLLPWRPPRRPLPLPPRSLHPAARRPGGKGGGTFRTSEPHRQHASCSCCNPSKPSPLQPTLTCVCKCDSLPQLQRGSNKHCRTAAAVCAWFPI
jgi:hypothetical protein